MHEAVVRTDIDDVFAALLRNHVGRVFLRGAVVLRHRHRRIDLVLPLGDERVGLAGRSGSRRAGIDDVAENAVARTETRDRAGQLRAGLRGIDLVGAIAAQVIQPVDSGSRVVSGGKGRLLIRGQTVPLEGNALFAVPAEDHAAGGCFAVSVATPVAQGPVAVFTPVSTQRASQLIAELTLSTFFEVSKTTFCAVNEPVQSAGK